MEYIELLIAQYFEANVLSQARDMTIDQPLHRNSKHQQDRLPLRFNRALWSFPHTLIHIKYSTLLSQYISKILGSQFFALCLLKKIRVISWEAGLVEYSRLLEWVDMSCKFHFYKIKSWPKFGHVTGSLCFLLHLELPKL